jgi:hypothetical protein
MAAAFFQGMLGAFTPYTAFSSDGGARASRDGRWGGGNSYPPGHGGNPGGVQPASGSRGGDTQGSSTITGSYMANSSAPFTGIGNSTSGQETMPKKNFKSPEV